MAKILIKNAFLDLKNPENYLLACRIVEGDIKEGDILKYKGAEILEINNIEKIKINKEEESYILNVKEVKQSVNFFELHDKTIEVISA